MKGAPGKQSRFTNFLVASGLRILQRFAAICRGSLLIYFVFNRGLRFPKPKVACSTHAGTTIKPTVAVSTRKKKVILVIAVAVIAGSGVWLVGLPEHPYQLVSHDYNFSAAFPDTQEITNRVNDEGLPKSDLPGFPTSSAVISSCRLCFHPTSAVCTSTEWFRN
jgi:hypothetical protein